MNKTIVRELMVPLDDYAVVPDTATLLDAVKALDRAQERLPAGRQPHRAVLVADKSGAIVGKIGQLGFLKGLEPKYNMLGDLDTLARAGVSDILVSTMRDHFRYFEDTFSDICQRGAVIPVRDVMHAVREGIDESATLSEALHQLVMWQQLSLLVTRGGRVTGLIRLSDLFDEVARQMKAQSRS